MKPRACLFLLAAVAVSRADDEALRDLRAAIDALPAPIAAEQSHGRLGFYGLGAEPARITVDLGSEVVPDEVVLFPARLPTGTATGDGSNGFPPSLSVAVAVEQDESRRVVLARWTEADPGSGNHLPFLRLPGNGASGRYLTLEIGAFRPREAGRGWFFTLGEIVVLKDGVNIALGRPASATASTENAPRWQVENLTDGFLWCLPFTGRAGSPANGYHSAIDGIQTNLPKWVEVDLGLDLPVDGLQLVPAHPRDFADVGGFGFPPRFRITGFSEESGEVPLFDTGVTLFPNPGAATVSFPGSAVPVRRVRVEALELWQRTGDFIFALGELQVISAGKNVARGVSVSFGDTTTTASWRPEALVDGFSSRHELLDWRTWLDSVSERGTLQSRHDQLAAILVDEREERMRRWLVIAGMAVAIVMIAAYVMVASVRRRSARDHEAWRARLAGDLHDEIGASLSHLALQSDLARRTVGADDPLAKRLASLSESARETLDHLRDTVWLLDPACGSWSQVDSRLASVSARLLGGLSHEFERKGSPPESPAPPERSREIVLFLKEALTNLRRHAGSANARVFLGWEEDRLILEVADTGRGFDPDSPEAGRGRGIANLKTRAGNLGGICRIESCSGGGTVIRLETPL